MLRWGGERMARSAANAKGVYFAKHGQPPYNADKEEIELLKDELQAQAWDLEIQCRAMQDTVAELEESRNRYAELYDFAPVGYATFDDKGCIREINLTGAALLGRERSQLIGFPMSAFVSKDNWKLFFDHLRACRLTGEQAITELKLSSKKTKRIHAQLITKPLPGIVGDRPQYRTVIADITCLKNAENKITSLMAAEKALRDSQTQLIASEARYHGLFNHMQNAFALCKVIVDERGCPADLEFVDVNPAFEKVYGFKAADFRGRSMVECFREIQDDVNLWVTLLGEVAISGQPLQSEIYSQATGKWFRVAAYCPEKGYVANATEDITKQKLVEKTEHDNQVQLARLDRLNLIGKIAASIGHEVRNPLTSVRGFLQLFQGKQKYTDLQEHFNLMIEELDRANLIITEFLSLAKNKRVELEPRNLSRIIKNLFPLMQADALREGKQVLLDLDDIPKLPLDENEIKQCILNLVRNALEAVSTGGVVTIYAGWNDDNTVCLKVSDTGPGIPPEIYAELGTPFLTTKEKGTGLGLSVCYRIAEHHNAKMEVETGSAGTTFSLKFGSIRNRYI